MRPWFRSTALGLLETQDALTENDVRRGARLLVVDGVCSMTMAALAGGPFLAAFALGLGAPNYVIGLLASIGFVSQVMQIPGVYLLRGVRLRRAITVVCAGLSRLCWVPILLIPFFGQGPTFLVQWLLLAGLLASLPGPAWNSLLHELVPADRLGWVYSRRMMGGAAVSLVLTLGGGLLVDAWASAFPWAPLYGYSLVMLAGLIVGLAGVAAIARLPEPVMRDTDDSALLEALARPVQDRNYRRLLVFIVTWNFALTLASPFFVIYMLKRIGLSIFAVTVLTTLSQLTHIVFVRIWGRLADRYSNKWVVSASGPLAMIAIALWVFTTLPAPHALTWPLLVAIHVLSGMSLSGVTLASGNIALKLAPPGAAHTYVTVFGLGGAVSGAVAPLVGGALSDFFAHRGLRVTLTWAEPTREFSVNALQLGSLDFLFLLSVVTAAYSLGRLRRVRETGQITDRSVLEELLDEVVLPFRSVSSVDEMVKRLTALPLRAWPRPRPPGADARPPDGGRSPS